MFALSITWQWHRLEFIQLTYSCRSEDAYKQGSFSVAPDHSGKCSKPQCIHRHFRPFATSKQKQHYKVHPRLLTQLVSPSHSIIISHRTEMELDLSTLSVEDEDLDDGPEELEAIKNTPALFKAYFDDPAMSDITVKLSDRSLHLHRIVLCRASEYFSSLLTKNFKVRALTQLVHHIKY